MPVNTLAIMLAVQLAVPLGTATAQRAVPTPRPETAASASACGGFPVPDFAPPFVPPIHDYMSLRSWFVHQPGATTVGQIYVPFDAVAWPYTGTDSITFVPQGMTTYSQTDGAGDRLSAYFDSRAGVAGILEQCGTASIYVVVQVKDAPRGLPLVDHIPQVTDKGVTLGMTPDQVKTLVGNSDSYHTQHIDDFFLYQWKKPSDCRGCQPDRFAMKFDFENGRLIAMSYEVWRHPTIGWKVIGR